MVSVRPLLWLALLLPFAATAGKWTALEDLQRQGAVVSALAVDLDSGETLQSLNPSTRLSPASLSKLVIAAAALSVWPSEQTFSTRVSASGTRTGSTLEGALILEGGGDATLDHVQLWHLAAQVKASGIRRVADGLIVVAEPYGVVPCETRDRCESLRKTATSYESQVAALGVDYGAWCIEVVPGAVTRPATLQSCGSVALPIAVSGSIRTVAGNSRTSFQVDRFTSDGVDELRARGQIASGPSQRLYRSMSDPPLGAGLLFRRYLEALNIDIDGSVRREALPERRQPIASLQGQPVREQIGRVLRHSNNYIADVLTMNLSADSPTPALGLAEASQRMAALVFGLDPVSDTLQAQPLLSSGSGLTPENRLSAEDLVGVLWGQYRDSSRFPAFYSGLVVPSQGSSRFLKRNASADWLQRVAVKTGTLTEPVVVHGLSGYLRKREGGWIAFTAIVNGAETGPKLAFGDAALAVRKDLEVLLAEY